MKHVDFDRALGMWLIRIGVKPFSPKPHTSPIINYLLSHYSYSICRAMLNEQTSLHISAEDIFRQCGIPNVLLAQLYAHRLIETLQLHGQRLYACEQQRFFLSQTSFANVIDYSFSGFTEDSINEIALSTIEADDALEVEAIRANTSYTRPAPFSLRTDNAFMLCHSIATYLDTKTENALIDVALSLKPFVNSTLLKTVKNVTTGNAKYAGIDLAYLHNEAATASTLDIAAFVSTLCPIPFSLLPKRYALVTTFQNKTNTEHCSVAEDH